MAPGCRSPTRRHGHYASPGKHTYRRIAERIATLTVDLFDITGDGIVFDASRQGNYRLILVPDGNAAKPAWYDFDARWGQYEKLDYFYHVGGVYPYEFKEVESGPQHSGGCQPNSLQNNFEVMAPVTEIV